MEAGSDPLASGRLQELFGPELAGRLSKLVNLDDPPSRDYSPTEASAEPSAPKAEAKHLPNQRASSLEVNADHTGTASDEEQQQKGSCRAQKLGTSSRSARAAALERAGCKPDVPLGGTAALDLAGCKPDKLLERTLPAGVAPAGLFSRMRDAEPSYRPGNVCREPHPGASSRNMPRADELTGSRTTHLQHSVSDKSCNPEQRRESAEDPAHTAAEKRRQEMTARAQAALRRKHRRDQEAGGPKDRDALPTSSGRELYTLHIECRATRHQTLSIVLTKAEFKTFTFKDLQQRLMQERHWGPELPVSFAVQDSFGRARVVSEHEVISTNTDHNGTVVVEFSVVSSSTAAMGRPSVGSRPSSGRASERPWSASSSSGPPPAYRPASGDFRKPRACSAAPRPGYASRAAGGGSAINAAATSASQDFAHGALWSSDLTSIPQSPMNAMSDRQLQVFLAQAGMASNRIRNMPRSQLLQNAEAHVQAWEVARVLACNTPWQVLRISSDANASTAKAAYRKLSMKIHPDKNPSSSAARAMSVATDALKPWG